MFSEVCKEYKDEELMRSLEGKWSHFYIEISQTQCTKHIIADSISSVFSYRGATFLKSPAFSFLLCY